MIVRGGEKAALASAALQQLTAQPPSQLQEFEMRVVQAGIEHLQLSPTLDMRRLQQLQRLVCSNMQSQLLVLPAQLRHLQLGCISGQQLAAVMPLQQLAALTLRVGFQEQEPLLRLAQLPALQELRLSYSSRDWAAAVATSPAWGQLQQLCELRVHCHGTSNGQTTGRQLAAVVAGAAAGVEGGQHAAQQATLEVCASIAGLTRLKHLDLRYLGDVATSPGFTSAVVPGDVLHLTALTGLVSLGLLNGGARVSDLVATALARGLKQLHTLDLRCCELGSMACLGAIAYLPQLRELWLMGTHGITPQGLMMLTRLSRLQCLGVDRNDEVTDAVVDEFWATLRSSNG